MSNLLEQMNIKDLSDFSVNEKIKQLQHIVLLLEEELTIRRNRAKQIAIEKACRKDIESQVFFLK